MSGFTTLDGKSVDEDKLFIRAVDPKGVDLEVRKLLRKGPGKHGTNKYGQEFRSGSHISGDAPYGELGIVFTSSLDNIIEASGQDLGSGMGKETYTSRKNAHSHSNIVVVRIISGLKTQRICNYSIPGSCK